MNKGQKRHSQLIIAGCNSAKNLELIEKAFYQVTLFVSVKVTRPWVGAILPWRNGVACFNPIFSPPPEVIKEWNLQFDDDWDEPEPNISNATADNICFYMAINQINKDYVDHVCRLARDTDHVKAVSFNFHTPYPDTKELALSKAEKAQCCDTIKRMMDEGCPVFNLKSAFPYLIENKFPTPCHQCLVIEDGKISTCGRCIEVPGLCEQCGYFFVAEYTLLFRGNVKIIFEMLRTYLKYI